MLARLMNQSPITLESYQVAAIDRTIQWLCENEGNPIVVAPTGAGKSFIIAGIIEAIEKRWGGGRYMVLAHVKELVNQNHEKLGLLYPSIDMGIFCADLGRKEIAQVTFGSVQSVARSLDKFPTPSVLIIDESHLCSPAEATAYQKIIRKFKGDHPNLRVIGLTATPFRNKEGELVDGENWHAISYEISVKEVMKTGRLCRIVGKVSHSEVSCDTFRTKMGEYNHDDVEGAFVDREMEMLNECFALGKDRKSWLIFAASLKHASKVYDILDRLGEAVRLIDGDTPSGLRDQWIQEFKDGKVRILVNYGVLTTGFDAPNIDLVVLMRATKSKGLFTQMVGRGMRAAPNKENCMVLDYGGNFRRFGTIDMDRQKMAKKGKGDAPIRVCETCQTVMPAALTKCPECGHEYPRVYGKDIESIASTAPVMVGDPEILDVQSTNFNIHVKDGKRSLCVTYHVGLYDSVREYIAIDHPPPQARATRWWQKMGGIFPSRLADNESILAMAKQLSMPTKVSIKHNGKYRNVERHYW